MSFVFFFIACRASVSVKNDGHVGGNIAVSITDASTNTTSIKVPINVAQKLAIEPAGETGREGYYEIESSKLEKKHINEIREHCKQENDRVCLDSLPAKTQ